MRTFKSRSQTVFAVVLTILLQVALATPVYAQDSPTTDNLITTQTQIEQVNNNLRDIQKARNKIKNAISLGRFIQKLDSLAWIEFPVVLSDTVSNIPIHIVFDHLRLYPEYAQLEVIVGVELPQRKVSAIAGEGLPTPPAPEGEEPNEPPTEYVELFFGTPDLKFSHDGGIIGDATIGLYSDVPIGSENPDKFAFIMRGYEVQQQAGGHTLDLGTYVKIDCDGFVELGLAADILFSRDWMRPTNSEGDTLTSQTARVTGHIQTIVNDLNNILVEVSLPNFVLTKYPDVAFSLNNAVFDFSDYRNSASMVFPPQYYTENLLPPGNPNLWRGVYVRSLEVMLPRQFDKVASATQVPGGGNNEGGAFLADENGVWAIAAADLPPPNPDRETDFIPIDELFRIEAEAAAGPTPPLLSLPPTAPAAAPENESLPPSRPRTKVGVEHLIVDNHGVSGNFYAENVITMGEVQVESKWDFSVNYLSLELVASNVVGFGFGGELAIPINKKGKEFSYVASANIPLRTYNFNVTAQEDLDFPIFKLAQVGIDSSSYIHITSTPDKRFRGTAVLHGYAVVKGKASAGIPGEYGDNSGEEARTLAFNAPRLEFKSLALSTYGPAIDILPSGGLKFVGQPSVLGYPLPISNPSFQRIGEDMAMITVDFEINLMNQEDNGFAGSCSVGIKGKLDQVEGSRRWRSDGLTVSDIEVEIALPKIYIYGRAHVFQDDEVYGRGFQGSLEVDIGPRESPTFELDMNALFGKTDFRYWYVDGMVQIGGETPLDIPIIPGVVHINGFGGGAYYHMKMVPGVALIPGDGIGELPSGVRYEPHLATTLGLKASVPLTSPAETLDGVATLDLRFEGTTLMEMSFYGRAEIVSPKLDQFAGGFADAWEDRISDLELEPAEQKAKDEQATEAPVNSILASLYINFNFDNGLVFKGVARVNISAAEGRIVGDGGIDILADTHRDKYHIYVGGYIDNSITAGDGDVLPPVSVALNLGSGITARAGAYFLTGNDIPGPPPLHPMAEGVCGGANPNPGANRQGNSGQFAQGTGFAFGAFIEAHIDSHIRRNRNNFIRGEAGAGFDISILKYARNTRCEYVNKSPHGLKGWRATGNLWIVANLSYRKGAFRGSQNFKMVIQGDIPNPTYLSILLKVKVLGVINVCVNPKIGQECGRPQIL